MWIILTIMLLFQIMVMMSGVVAFTVNLSIYWIIGNTSPVTYPSMLWKANFMFFVCLIITMFLIYKQNETLLNW